LIFEYNLKDILTVIILGFLGTYVYYLFLYLGYKEAVGLEVLVVQYLWPILIVIFSIFILKEKITILKSISVALGFLAVMITLTKGNLTQIDITNLPVIVLVFLGASSFALFSVLSKKITLEPMGVITIYFLVATIASFVSMLYFSEFKFPDQTEFLPIIVNGVFLNGISYLLWIKALKLVDASYLAPFIFITPILSAFYLILFFNEPVYISYMVGLVLVVISGITNKGKSTKIS
jgi:drug/metabolite transporter (DMT)-like permease